MLSKRTKLAAVYLGGVLFSCVGVVADRDANVLGLDTNAAQKVRESVAARHGHRSSSRSESDEDSRAVMAGELLDRAAAHKSLFGFGGKSQSVAVTQPEAQALAVEKPQAKEPLTAEAQALAVEKKITFKEHTQAKEPLTAEAKPKGESKRKPDQTQGGKAKSAPGPPGPPASSEEGEATDSKAPDVPGIHDHVAEFKKVLDGDLLQQMWQDELAARESTSWLDCQASKSLDTGSWLWSKTKAQTVAADVKAACKKFAKRMEAAEKSKKEFDQLIEKVRQKTKDIEENVKILSHEKEDVQRQHDLYEHLQLPS